MLDPIVTALKDDDDDVRAVAASALLPVAESLVTFAPNRVSTASFTLSTVTVLYSLMLQPLGTWGPQCDLIFFTGNFNFSEYVPTEM